MQLCILHQVRASLNYVSWKQRKAVAADLQLIYRANTTEDAYFKLETFAEKWDGAYPTISQMWRRNWEHLTPFFAYPADIRKVIYTTNTIESLNMSLRKVIKTRGSFPSPDVNSGPDDRINIRLSTSEAAQYAPDGSSSDLESPGDFGFAEAGAVQLTDLDSMRGRGCRPPQTLSVQSDI